MRRSRKHPRELGGQPPIIHQLLALPVAQKDRCALRSLVGTIAILAVVFFLRSSPQTIGIVMAALSAVVGAAPLRARVFGRSGGGSGGDAA